ncbi:MAG: SAM-dependent methyltransferase [Planctomycetes bacterium]|nr:SAM-dependent methyltransferase [Planctomycetota bacterium]
MPTAPTTDHRTRFLALLRDHLADHTFVKAVLAKPRGGEPGLQRVEVRLILLRGEDHLQFVQQFTTRDVTRNVPLPAAVGHFAAQLGRPFANAHLFTHQQEIQYRIGKRSDSLTTSRRETAPAAPADDHDRAKTRHVDVTRPFLHELGITGPDHRVVPAMARKWKQIDKFVEVFAGAIGRSPLADATSIDVVDFGAGKGYLTFAVHDWLRQRGIGGTVTGVELRDELVLAGNDVVARLGLQGLTFCRGDVHAPPAVKPQVLIALHACDTATDHALHLGVRAGAAVLIAAPCCHKEVRPQLQPPALFAPLLQHGIHQDRQAELLTDSLRALLLQAHGYDAQVFEFVSTEHTHKNQMILAIRRGAARPEALRQARELQAAWGITDLSLARMLAAPA